MGGQGQFSFVQAKVCVTMNADLNVLQLFESLGEAPYTVFSKNLRVALTTIFFNISCLGLSKALDGGVRDQLLLSLLGVSILSCTIPLPQLISCAQVLGSESTESEAVYRALVAIGNVVGLVAIDLDIQIAKSLFQAYAAKQSGSPLGSDETAQLKPLLRSAASTFPEDRIRSISAEIFMLLV